MISTFICFGCGRSDTTANDTPVSTDAPATETQADESEETSTDDLSDLDALGDVEVEKELFDVILTIPADYVEATTQEELDKAAKEYGYTAILNEDGSATYTMSKSQHNKMMEDFTAFTVTTKNEESDLAESFSIMAFICMGVCTIFSMVQK